MPNSTYVAGYDVLYCGGNIWDQTRSTFRIPPPPNGLIPADCWHGGEYYPCRALHSPLCSAWKKLVCSEHNSLLIQTSGLDFWLIRYLLVWIAPNYEQNTCLSKDGHIKKVKIQTSRPSSLNPQAEVGMLLMHTRTRGGNLTLLLIFGVRLPRVNLWRWFSLCVLLSVLQLYL